MAWVILASIMLLEEWSFEQHNRNCSKPFYKLALPIQSGCFCFCFFVQQEFCSIKISSRYLFFYVCIFARVRLGGAFYAVDFSLFYSKLAKLPWHVFFPLRDPFDSVMPTVQATSSSSCALYHSVGIAERVSKYMTSLRSPWLRGQTINGSVRETDISRPVALPAAGRVLVTGKRNRFQVSLDCAGEQLLYKRGYRNFISQSPLRESFTAAVLEAVDHDLNGTLNDYAVVDPFCGSG